MNFHEYSSEYHSCRRKNIIDNKTSWQEFYELAIETVKSNNIDPFAPMRLRIEESLFKNKRPYYNIYPGIIPALTKVDLEKLTIDDVSLPLPELILRFPDTNHALNFIFNNKKYYVKTILVADKFKFIDKKEDFLIFFIDVGETIHDYNVQMIKILCKKKSSKVTDVFDLLKTHDSANEGIIYPDDFIVNCAKLICTVCLMSGDEDVIQPEVLSADETKYEKTKDSKYVEKAIKRGKCGWSVGKNIEISPHIRASCPAALYWTGVGKKIPKVRFRKGCIVHKKKISELPTGYLNENEIQDT